MQNPLMPTYTYNRLVCFLVSNVLHFVQRIMPSLSSISADIYATPILVVRHISSMMNANRVSRIVALFQDKPMTITER